jgi:hypothetical protein
MKRLKLGLAALLMVVAAGVFTAVASADSSNSGLPGALNPTSEAQSQYGANYPAFLPQETNIAYLAWRGEEIRFVKCSASIPSGLAIYGDTGVPASWAPNTINLFVEDFSGDPHYQPKPVVGTFSYTTRHNSDGTINCVRGDFESNKPGLASIKLVVTDAFGNKALEHQFLAGWMAIGPTSMDPTDTTVSEPAGNDVANNLTIQTSGTIPVDEEWQADWSLPASLTMPNDWPLLASKIATTSQSQRRANPSVAAWKYWDIHDSSGPASLGGDGGQPDIHVPGFCPPPNNTSTTIDQVDDCQGGGPFGQFSRVFGDSTLNGSGVFTAGSFDPQYPEETLLSDGNLNALDAPMPPLRIDVNSNGNTGFFGYQQFNPQNIKLCNANYVRDPNTCSPAGNPGPHNWFAPFYGAFIPDTYRNNVNGAGDASGTDGPQLNYFPNGTTAAAGNNFEGYLPPFLGEYTYWEIADVLINAEGGPTNCLLRTVRGEPVFRQLNSGPQSIAVYTDEHGEAVVTWIPGLNNDLFGNLGPDDNGGCDIEGMDLGGADITAQAEYPFQHVAQNVDVPGTLHKAVENLFNKSISCRLKNNQNPAGTAGEAYICTASAQDIDGSGDVFNGEQVCISREPTGTLYPYPRNGATGTQGELCILLSGGDATHPATGSIETPATLNGTLVDVSAFFNDENIIRDTCITVGQPTSTPGPCGAVTIAPPTPGGGAGGSNTPGTTVVSPVNSTTTLTGAANVTAQTGNAVKSIKASVVSVKVVKTRNGRALVVKVQSPKKTATVRIVLVGKNGRVLVRTVRTIQANKLVRISHLLVPRNVKAVHVNVLR